MDPALLRLAAVLALLALTTITGRTVTGRRSRLRRVGAGPTDPRRPAEGRAQGRAVGPSVEDDAGPTAMLFGSPTCAPCATLKKLLRTVQESRPGFEWRYVDAADHLDLAREHGVRTVPTLLVLDGRGQVVARTTGVPRLADLDASVAAAADPTGRPGATDPTVGTRSA